MKTLSALLLFALVTRAAAQSPPTPLGAVKEGVYFLNGVFQTTIVELKGGQFRYWFSSDLKIGGEPHYPVSGNYITTGGTITFVTLAASNISQIASRLRTNETGGVVGASFGGWGGTTNGILLTNRIWSTNIWTFINYKE